MPIPRSLIVCRQALAVSMTVLTVGLAACGGGGGAAAQPSASSPTPATPSPTPSTPAPSPMPAPPVGKSDAARFLQQASFGPKLAEIDALATATSYDSWLSQQAALPVTRQLPYLQQLKANGENVYQNQRQDIWWRNAVTAPDQLRQRMAFALSEIMVVSDQGGGLENDVLGLGNYYDLLSQHALGSFRTLLEAVTLSPQMGRYLSMLNNQKPDAAKGIRADENFARESMQLFTVGKQRLNADGTSVRDGSGVAIPSYTQADIENLARVLTGWSWASERNRFRDYTEGDELLPMQAFEAFHDTGAKTLIGGVAVPAGQTAAQDLKLALDTLFNHPNTAPFISQQLIQRLVTSNPSPGYVQRVAAVFADNGQGQRGDLFAVAKAILTDAEARSSTLPASSSYGKVREPMLRLTQAWRVFDAVGRNNRHDYWNVERDFQQAALRSPSVFNFFQPGYQPVGAIATAGLVAPEMQIVQESAVVSSGNKLWDISNEFQYSGGLGGSYYNERTVLLDFRPWEAKASNARMDELLGDLDVIFLSGQMPSAMRPTLRDYLLSLPENQPQRRLADATMLILTSPQYAVQK